MRVRPAGVRGLARARWSKRGRPTRNTPVGCPSRPHGAPNPPQANESGSVNPLLCSHLSASSFQPRRRRATRTDTPPFHSPVAPSAERRGSRPITGASGFRKAGPWTRRLLNGFGAPLQRLRSEGSSACGVMGVVVSQFIFRVKLPWTKLQLPRCQKEQGPALVKARAPIGLLSPT